MIPRTPSSRAEQEGVICLDLGCMLKPFFLVLHLKIKLLSMFSITIDLIGKFKAQATARGQESEGTLS